MVLLMPIRGGRWTGFSKVFLWHSRGGRKIDPFVEDSRESFKKGIFHAPSSLLK